MSVAAGIPSFRGSGGIHADKIDGVAVKDLMSINALKVSHYCIITYQDSNNDGRALACLRTIAN